MYNTKQTKYFEIDLHFVAFCYVRVMHFRSSHKFIKPLQIAG